MKASYGTAREIFACTPEIAEAAVEKAIAESEVNRIELAKQRQQRIKRDKLAKAPAKYDEQLEKFTEGCLREWEASQWVKSQRLVLDKFVAGNSFETKGYLPKKFIVYGLISGVLSGVFAIASIIMFINNMLNSPSILNLIFVPGILIFSVASYSFVTDNCLKIVMSDQEALAKKEAMEEEIETNKQTIIANAKNDFEKHFTLKNFYE